MKNNIPTYWYVMMAYMAISLCMVIASAPKEWDITSVYITRILFIVLWGIVYLLKGVNPQKFQFISLLLIYAFLGSVYKETALLNTLLFSKQDALVSHWDYLIFGFQPAIVFSRYFNHYLFSELMFIGYFSYYIIPVFIMISLYHSRLMNHFGFVFIVSFIVYYIIFILFPVQGPQFYYPFPQNQIEAQGFFGNAVKLIQNIGEAPTAAFPSSHIGITTIILIWLYQYQRKILPYVIPFSILLFFSTVYIKAHYAVDVFAGVFSGIIIYWAINTIYLRHIYE